METTPLDPLMELAQRRFLLKSPSVIDSEKAELKAAVLADVLENNKAPLYRLFTEEFGWEVDDAKLAEMEAANAAALEGLASRLKDAEENLGESEVREALLARAEFYATIGDKAAMQAAVKETEAKTVAVGQKMDLLFLVLRIAFFYLDQKLISDSIARSKTLLAEGGDWERKNRLKVYEGLYLMSIRQLSKAADLFLDSIATFTASELSSYPTFVLYTVLTSIVSLDRVSLKAKVVDAPEILAVILDVPHLSGFLNSLYGCRYSEFYRELTEIADTIRRDSYLFPHYRYLIREVRMVAYSQFLQSYKSVTLQSMAEAFGVSTDFLDTELAGFIAAGRLNCKIDKVNGVVETNRPDTKNALYQQTIKQGDLLLNRVQKLSRVINL